MNEKAQVLRVVFCVTLRKSCPFLSVHRRERGAVQHQTWGGREDLQQSPEPGEPGRPHQTSPGDTAEVFRHGRPPV